MPLELKNSIWIDLIPHDVRDLSRTRRAGLIGSPVLVTRVLKATPASATGTDHAAVDAQQAPARPIEELAGLLNEGARRRPWAARGLAVLGLLALSVWMCIGVLDWWGALQARRSLVEASQAPTWTVRKGETLYQIAKAQGVTIADLRTWNGITGDRIEIGQVLNVGAPPAPEALTRAAVVAPAHHDQRATSLVLGVLCLVGAVAARWQTAARRRVVQVYLIDEPAGAVLAELVAGIESVRSSARLWRVFDQTHFSENQKWMGGASVGVDLLPGAVLPSGPRQLKCNAPVWGLTGMGLNLYVLPDGVLVHYLQQDRYLGLPFAELRAEGGRTRMLVETLVPSDARQVGTSWAKVNKDGSPDLRFKHNRQIPICEYGVLAITGANSLDESWYTSRSDAPDRLVRAWPRLTSLVALPLPRSTGLSRLPPAAPPDESILDTPTIP